MRIKDNYTLKKIADVWSVIPLGDAVLNLTGILTLNDSGRILWELLLRGATYEDLANAMLSEYDVSYDEAYADAVEFVEKLDRLGCIEM